MDDDNKEDEIVEIVGKRKYEQAVSECNKLQTFIEKVDGRKIKVISEKEYDCVRAEYGRNINDSVFSNGDDEIADVWNEHKPKQVPDTKRGKYQNSLLTDDDNNLSMSNNISNNLI